jgi:hypothetical protein
LLLEHLRNTTALENPSTPPCTTILHLMSLWFPSKCLLKCNVGYKYKACCSVWKQKPFERSSFCLFSGSKIPTHGSKSTLVLNLVFMYIIYKLSVPV